MRRGCSAARCIFIARGLLKNKHPSGRHDMTTDARLLSILDGSASDRSTVSSAPGMPDLPYKEEHTLEQRKASSASIRAKHPDRIPVIVVCARATRSLCAPHVFTSAPVVPLAGEETSRRIAP